MKKALFTKGDKCMLCPHNCVILEGKTGICGVRKNINGKIFSLVYGKPCSIAIDPVEKKPLYHFYPGQNILSLGTVGCNFKCIGCQNYEIARGTPDESDNVGYAPEEIIKLAKQKNCSMIAYTYTEPTIFYEYMIDIAKLAKKNGLKNVIVSNGYINPAPLIELCKYIDAANIDLKFFNNDNYLKYSGAKLNPVLETLKILKQQNVWLEITNLIIPGWSDDLVEFENMCKWIKDNLGKDVPLHISRFFPHYKLQDVKPTSLEILEKAENIAKQYLNYVYTGNVFRESNTYCIKCNNLLIDRQGYVINNKVKGGVCSKCNKKLPGVYNQD